MNTTDTEFQNDIETLNRDDKAMKQAYERGETINDLALTYGMAPEEVSAIVVTEVKTETLKTQAEIDAKETKK